MRQIFTKAVFTAFSLVLAFTVANSQIILEEDFADGLPTDWEAVQMDGSAVGPNSNWQWTMTGGSGPFAIADIASTTAANGWMMFDSDAGCPMTEQDAWLISPSMDCTSFDDVVITFETYYRRFADSMSVEVSIDDGLTWSTFYPFPNVGNTEYAGATDGSQNPVTAVVIVSDLAANQPNVKFAIRYLSNANTQGGANYFGCGYNLHVDDVVVTSVDPTPMFDMRANTNFFAIPQNISTPASQVESIGFLCDIENIGQQDMTGVNLNMTITDDSGAEVHNQDLLYGTVASGFLDENRIFPDRYTPPATAGVLYDMAYTITSDSTDEVPDNNVINFQFEVTDSVFRKENGTGGAVSPTNNNSGNWTMGAYYYVPNGDGMVCSSVEFGVGNQNNDFTGAIVNVYLYEWVDVNNDGVAGADERDGSVAGAGNIIANSGYEIQDGDNVVSLVLEPWTGSGQIKLKDDTHYILSLEVEADVDGDLVTIVGNQNIDYGAMGFLNDSLNMPRYTALWNPDGLGFSENLTQLGGFAPYLRMHINEETMVSTNDQLADENIVEVFPNPVSDVLNLKLDFVTALDNVNIRITDATGKTLVNQAYSSITQQIENFDVSKFAAGTYFVHVQTDAGNRVERFVVMK